jgi:hypothetical protein
MPRRILSIASAPGWKARFAADDEVDGFAVVTLVAWALVEVPGGDSEVVGLVQRGSTAEAPNGSIALADDVADFRGYTFTGVVTRADDA